MRSWCFRLIHCSLPHLVGFVGLCVLYTAYLFVRSPLTISSLYRCVYYPSFCVFFCGFSHVFSSLHLVQRGREDVAHAVSPSFIFVFDPREKNAQFFDRLRLFASLKSWSSSLQFSVVESSLAGGLVAERRAVAVLYGLRLHRRVEYTPLF